MKTGGYYWDSTNSPETYHIARRGSRQLSEYVPLSTLRSTRVVTSITELDKRPTIFYDDAKVEDESGLSFTSGVMSIFPSRGGVFWLMNSIVVGSMVPAWRRAVWKFSGVTGR